MIRRLALALTGVLIASVALGQSITGPPPLQSLGIYPSTDNTPSGSVAIGVGASGVGTAAAGYHATVVGKGAGAAVTTAVNTTAVGYLAGGAITQGANNVAVGASAAGAVTTGTGNTAMGNSALGVANGASTDNTCIGLATCNLNGVAGPINSSTAVGSGALTKITNDFNTAVGAQALANAGNTQANTALGAFAGNSITTGARNTVLGVNVARTTLTSGTDNILIGTANTVDTAANNTTNSLNIQNTITGTLTGGTNPAVCAVGMRCILGQLRSANFNVTTDQAIVIGPLTSGNVGYLSTGATKYVITDILVMNCSASLTTAKGGFYTATSKGGTIIGATTTPFTSCVSTTTMQRLQALTNQDTTVFTAATIYLSLTTAQGGAATGDVYIIGHPMN